jgi:hypothetical protein
LRLMALPGFLTARTKPKTVNGGMHSGSPKPSGRKAMATAFGTERCFPGGVHESRSNHHIGSVQWEIKQLKSLCRIVVWQRANPHWRAHSTAAPGI